MFGFKSSKQKRLEKALNSLQNGDSKLAMTELINLAKEEYADAEYWLGDINEFVFKNLEEAALWYRRAAEHGHPKSQWCLANLYMTGKGIEFNPREAVRFYHAAAKAKIPEAQFSLGEFYRSGSHVERDTDAALFWYQQSAQAGYEPAKTRIRQFWPNGVFQERSPEKTENASQEPLDVSEQSCAPNVGSLNEMIVEAAQQQGYVPKDDFPYIPELLPYQREIVRFICSHINEEMKSCGIDENKMVAVFRFVFRRGFDATYQWHINPHNQIDNTITVGNPFNDEQFLQLPYELRSTIDNINVPQTNYQIMASWWKQNGSTLQQKGVDIWQPLTVALALTFGVAVSIALKIFGYRK